DTVKKAPRNARAYDNLAAVEMLTDASRAADAEALLRRAIQLDSNFLTAWTNLAAVVAEQGRLGEAKRYAERAVKINPRSVQAAQRLGTVLVAMKDPTHAIPYLERVVADAPNDDNRTVLGA